MQYGFSVRDVVTVTEELRAESLVDTLVESTQFCVRKPSRR
jgi:hypothetical protein